MTCTRTIAALGLAAGLALNGLAFAQVPPTPTVTPNANNKVPPMTPESSKAVDMANPSAAMEADKLVASQNLMWATMPEENHDKWFALTAGCGNSEEVELAKYVAMKAQDPKVKELAETLVKEHGMANDKVKPIGEKLGVKYPMTVGSMAKASLVTLQNLPPEKLDMAFLSMMKANHLKTVSMYADHTPMIKDPALKAYAEETLPHIKAHTAMILEQASAKGLPTDMNFSKADHAGHGM